MIDIGDYGAIKKNLLMQVVSYYKEKETIERVPAGIPVARFEDLAIIFGLLDKTGKETQVGLVNNPLLKLWGITVDTLIDDALKWAPINVPGMMRPLQNPTWTQKFIPAKTTLYIATTGTDVGCGCLLFYPGFLEEAAKRIGGNFYILPVPNNELMFVKEEEELKPYRLKEMCIESNKNATSPKSKLTDSVYYYDAEDSKLKKVL